MNFRTHFASGALLLTALSAPAATHHGNFIICSTDDLRIKMTADLSDEKGEKVATAVEEGEKLVFPEVARKTQVHDFKFYPEKSTPFVVTRRGERSPEILLVRDRNETESPQVLFDRKEPLVYRMIKFKAFLTLKSLNITGVQVTCTESRWETD
jgi:hypothetical protein